MRAPTFVLFDMNGVLYRFDTALRLKLLAQAVGIPPERLASVWLDSGWEDKADAGAHEDGDAYLDAFSKLVGHRVDRPAWRSVMRQALRPNAAVIMSARGIRPGVGKGLLTNNGPLWREEFTAIAPAIPNLFGEIAHCSADFCLRKPDPRIFRAYCTRHSLDPADVLFIDDSPQHVEGARSTGMAGHHFTSPAALAAILDRLGLIENTAARQSDI
jgi:putative hydrolase of the HAD superfamily